MTFAEMKLELRARCQDLSDQRAGRFINDALQELASCYNWPFLEHSSDGAAPLTVSRCRVVLEVIDLDRDIKLPFIPHQLATDYDPKLAETGAPFGYYLTAATDGSGDQTVNTLPSSTGQIRVRHIIVPAALSGDSDTPSRIPTHYHGLIVDMAQLRAVRRHPENPTILQVLTAAVADEKREMVKAEFRNTVEPQYILSTEYQL